MIYHQKKIWRIKDNIPKLYNYSESPLYYWGGGACQQNVHSHTIKQQIMCEIQIMRVKGRLHNFVPHNFFYHAIYVTMHKTLARIY